MRDELEEIGFGTRLRHRRKRFSMRSVLELGIHPELVSGFRAEINVRAHHNEISSEPLFETSKRHRLIRISLPGREAHIASVTFSLGMMRSVSPAASSVDSISESATESHSISRRPVRFLKPSTASERRPGWTTSWAAVAKCGERTCRRGTRSATHEKQ